MSGFPELCVSSGGEAWSGGWFLAGWNRRSHGLSAVSLMLLSVAQTLFWHMEVMKFISARGERLCSDCEIRAERHQQLGHGPEPVWQRCRIFTLCCHRDPLPARRAPQIFPCKQVRLAEPQGHSSVGVRRVKQEWKESICDESEGGGGRLT